MIVGLYERHSLEKGVEEVIFPTWPAESLRRNTSVLSRNSVNWAWQMHLKFGIGLCLLEGRTMPLQSRTSNEGRVGRLKEGGYGQSG